MPEPPVVVVGAGIAGVACARQLVAAGVPVQLFDRGRDLGGRMASATMDGRPVDLGASYFTVSDPAFAAVAGDWLDRGLAEPWTDTFTVLSPGSAPRSTTGPMRWRARHGLRSLVRDLAGGLTVTRRLVESVDAVGEMLVVDGVLARAVVLAMPDTQALRPLRRGLEDVSDHLRRRSDPVITLAARWPERTWDDVAPDGRFLGAFVNDDEVIDWVADDGRRRGDDAPVLVAHSTTRLARLHLLEPDAASTLLVDSLRRLLGVPDPVETRTQRWALARPAGDRSDRYLLTDDLVGVCGDGWGATSKVETAFLSGRALGLALVARLGAGGNPVADPH